MSADILYTIGEVVELIGVSHRTLRHYESFFNLYINRDSSGNRIYYETDLEVINIIIDMKKQGMRLEGIRMFLENKDLIKKRESEEVALLDPKILEVKELILGEIRKTIEDSFTENVLLKELLEENKLLREKLESIEKIEIAKEDRFIEEMKNLKENLSSIHEKLENKKPWYKNLFTL